MCNNVAYLNWVLYARQADRQTVSRALDIPGFETFIQVIFLWAVKRASHCMLHLPFWPFFGMWGCKHHCLLRVDIVCSSVGVAISTNITASLWTNLAERAKMKRTQQTGSWEINLFLLRWRCYFVHFASDIYALNKWDVLHRISMTFYLCVWRRKSIQIEW